MLGLAREEGGHGHGWNGMEWEEEEERQYTWAAGRQAEGGAFGGQLEGTGGGEGNMSPTTSHPFQGAVAEAAHLWLPPHGRRRRRKGRGAETLDRRVLSEEPVLSSGRGGAGGRREMVMAARELSGGITTTPV